ncbi:hypothetical protein GRW41_25500 [Escherichia coli]|nr:hypothetical protein [Escherichia coli]
MSVKLRLPQVNGWALYAHPCFQETYDALVAEVETLKGKDPENYQRKAATKLCKRPICDVL